MGIWKNVYRYFLSTDKLYWLLMLLISAYGLLILKTIPTPPDNSRSYFTTQFIAMVIGYSGAIFITFLDYKEISAYWYVVAGFCFFLLIFTLKFGKPVTGADGVNARAWISVPVIGTFQPSELTKIGFLISFSKHLNELKIRGKLSSFLHVILLALHALIPIALVHLQGDDGAAIIFFCMFLFMAFGAGIPLRYFFGLALSLFILVPVAWKYIMSDYQKSRILITYNLDSDPLHYGYQQIQARTSIGSGGLWGRGLFQSPRVNNCLVSVQQSDFIFSAIGEQLGLIGCLSAVLLLFLFLLHTLRIAKNTKDLLGSSICIGFFGMITSQMLFNLGMCLDLLPVMGITLPFFSAGGSSAACLYFGFGLVLSVYMHHDRFDYGGLALNTK